MSVAEQINLDREFAEQLQNDDDDQISVNSINNYVAVVPPSTLQEALQQIKMSVTSSRKTTELTFFVQRSRVWKNVLEELKTIELSTCKMSVEFIGESAVDTGGPTRELFSLVYQQVMDGKLTRGSAPNLTFMHDQGALLAGEYKALEQLIALALLNEASGPHFFSPTVAQHILGSNTDPTSMVDEILDDQVEVKEKLKALLLCEDPNHWDEAIRNFEERFDMGITKARLPIEEKNGFIKATNRHIMVSSVAEEIFSFKEGLNIFGVLDALQDFPNESVKLFISAQVTVEDIKRTFIPVFSISGSSKRQCEETIVFNFYQFLKQCDKGSVQRKFIDITTVEWHEQEEEIPETEQSLTLQDVLQFLTGARNMPLGSIEGSIVFDHNALNGARVKANCCALQLSIPVNERYFSEESGSFISNFADDIFDGQGYGRV